MNKTCSSMIPSARPTFPQVAITIDPRPSTSLKSCSLFLVMVSVRPSVPPYKTKQTNQRVKTTFQASALVGAWAWIIVRLKSCSQLKFVLFCEIFKSAKGQTYENSDIATGRDCGTASWINCTLPFVGGAGKILLVTLGLFKSDSEHALLRLLGSELLGSVLLGRSEGAWETANEIMQKITSRNNL